MIDKLVVHLKNIIFFKIVVYTIIILILGVIIPMFITDLKKAYDRKQKALSFLRETTLKIESIHDFEEKIVVLNDDYNKLVGGIENLSCSMQTKFINFIEALAPKYQLFEPVIIKISKGYESDDSLINNGYVKMNYYTADIMFKAMDSLQLLTVANEIYNNMPYGAITLNTHIRSIDALTPDIIEALSVDKPPALLEVKIQILLRDIIYDK